MPGEISFLFEGDLAPRNLVDLPRLNDKLGRLQDVVTDSGATIVLTDPSTNAKVSPLLSQFAALRDLKWMVSDDLLSAAQRPGSVDLANTWQPPDLKSTTLASLQYTSGSTGQPKGVMISHGNLFHNQKLIQAALMHPERGPVVAWLPLYHDMGLIGNVLGSLYSGGHCILMSPVAFIQRPVRWLAAITRYRAVTSGGPNLAYDLCVRKITAGQLPALDLSSWEVA